MQRNTVEASEYNSYEAIRAAGIVIEKLRDADPVKNRTKIDNCGLAHRDAQACFNRGEWRYARERALDSLDHTVGVFSPIYQSAADRGPAR